MTAPTTTDTRVAAPGLTDADLRDVESDAAAAGLLPPRAYYDAELYEWELRHTWLGGWLCLGAAATLAQPGRRQAVDIGDQGFIMVRGQDGRIRTFANVCQHRGCQLIEPGPAADGKALRCPYHAWNYALDGTLRAAPFTTVLSEPGAERFGLTPVRTEVVAGLVFADPSGHAPDLAPQLGWIPGLAGRYGLEWLALGGRREWQVGANWKIVGENALECNHCPTVHPEFNRIASYLSIDESAGPGPTFGGVFDIGAEFATTSIDGDLHGRRVLPGLTAGDRRKAQVFHWYPGLVCSLSPDHVGMFWFRPVGPERCQVVMEWYFEPDVVAAPDFDPSDVIDLSVLTAEQDWKVCEQTQRGLHSTGFRGGRYSQREPRAHLFARLAAHTYRTGARPVAPAFPLGTPPA